MKATFFAYALLAAASIECAPTRPYKGEVVIDPEGATPIPSHHFCYLAGEPCTKAKRSPTRPYKGEVIIDPEGATPTPSHHFCYLAGEPCTKLRRAYDDAASAFLDAEDIPAVKRETLAVAEEAANALNAAYPEAQACLASDGACIEAKRQEVEELEKRAL